MAMFSSEIILDAPVPTADIRQRWESAAKSGAWKASKGEPLFVHSTNKSGKYVLHYYQSYGRDFCDAVFTGEVFDYDDGGSQIMGKVTVPTGIKRFSWGLIAASIPLALLFNLALRYLLPIFGNSGREIGQEITTVAVSILVLNVISIMCLIVDKRRVKAIMDYLHKFLNEDYSKD